MIEGGTRSSLMYCDALINYHRQNGTNLNSFPSVNNRAVDLYRLKKHIENKGGFESVCESRKWAEISSDLGYASSLSTRLKTWYQNWVRPYEDWLQNQTPTTLHGSYKQLKRARSSDNTLRRSKRLKRGVWNEGKTYRHISNPPIES